LKAVKHYFQEHWLWALVIFFCASISFRLIAGLWLSRQGDSAGKKLLWSAVLLVPFFGWVFYGAFYTSLAENDIKAPINTSAFYGGPKS
jgi:hypothetical protein